MHTYTYIYGVQLIRDQYCAKYWFSKITGADSIAELNGIYTRNSERLICAMRQTARRLWPYGRFITHSRGPVARGFALQAQQTS